MPVFRAGDAKVKVVGMSGPPKKVSAKEALLEALSERAARVAPVTLLAGMMIDGYRALSPLLGREIRLESWFMPKTALGDVGLGPNVDFLPMTWTQTCRYVETLDIDVCLVQVAPADETGYYSLGVSSSLNAFLVKRAKVVIAQ